MSTQTADSIRSEYEAAIVFAPAVAADVAAILQKALGDASIDLAFPIQWRIKSWNSVEQKIKRHSRDYDNDGWVRRREPIEHLSDIDDLVGIRVTVQFPREALKFRQIAPRLFSAFPAGHGTFINTFGYEADHYHFVRSSSDYGRLPIELQVRTTAQHVWASASHLMQYKQEHLTPRPIRRALHRLAAVLELVDHELERLLDEQERLTARFGRDGEALSSENMKAILHELLPDQAMWCDHVKHDTLAPGSYLPGLVEFGITTTGAFRALLTKHMASILEQHSRRIALRQTIVPTVRHWFIHTAMEAEFGHSWRDHAPQQRIVWPQHAT